MKVGICGLPYSGKTTIFEAITGAHGRNVEHTPTAHLATVTVPDKRLDRIAATIQPEKVTHARVDFIDIAGVDADMKREHVIGTLSSLREMDGIVHVVRFFDSPHAPPHPRGSLDAKRDAGEMDAELIVADLDIVEKRIEKLQKQIAKFSATLERDKKELAVLLRLKEALDAGRRIGTVELSGEESLLVRAFQFLSEKPMVNVLNVREALLTADVTKEAAENLGPNTIIIAGRAEKEIAELDPGERTAFWEDLGIGEPAAQLVIRACYEALGLRSFFTAGPPDVHAWTIRAGETAVEAAGKIHSDLARGFIRAEVISYADFLQFGSVKEARNQGRQRLEGKEYIVQDGDIITIRFKV